MKEKYYTSGEFAKQAHVTLRTIRWYDQKNVLKPSAYSDTGARLYTAQDLVHLQQILLLKYLGFSLDDIKEITLGSNDETHLVDSLKIQKKLVQERIEELKTVTKALDETIDTVQHETDVDWNNLLNLIHMTTNEDSLKTQYIDATNISSRIRLHQEYSINPQGWFPWLFEQCQLRDGMKILEVGCGNGELWKKNIDRLPENISVVLTDISEGMLHDARQSIGDDHRFTFRKADVENLPFSDNTFDLVIANHMLFYCDGLQCALQNCKMVLKSDGKLICSTYGRKHMHEITELVQGFNQDIVLSSESLYEKFGLENGEELLKPFFSEIDLKRYEDGILIEDPEPLIAYILSCHGNQNHILLDRYKDFKSYVSEKVTDGFKITKDAGIFVCKKANYIKIK